MRRPWSRDEFAGRLRAPIAPRRVTISCPTWRPVLRGGERPAATSRPALAVVLSVAVIGVVAALGGVGYADSAAHQVANEVRHAVAAPTAATVHRQVTPADSQYCHGDDCYHRRHHRHQHSHHHHNRGQAPG